MLQLLSHWGYQAMTAEDGLDALEKLQIFPPMW